MATQTRVATKRKIRTTPLVIRTIKTVKHGKITKKTYFTLTGDDGKQVQLGFTPQEWNKLVIASPIRGHVTYNAIIAFLKNKENQCGTANAYAKGCRCDKCVTYYLDYGVPYLGPDWQPSWFFGRCTSLGSENCERCWPFSCEPNDLDMAWSSN